MDAATYKVDPTIGKLQVLLRRAHCISIMPPHIAIAQERVGLALNVQHGAIEYLITQCSKTDLNSLTMRSYSCTQQGPHGTAGAMGRMSGLTHQEREGG